MQNNDQKNDLIMKDRRKLLISAIAGGGAAMLMPRLANASSSLLLNQTSAELDPKTAESNLGKRYLGTLSVSSIGLGVQNVSRKYDTSVPYRPEMIKVICSAFDNGVTFL